MEEIRRLKQKNSPDLQVYGSSQLLQTLLKHDLVDELWLKISPLTLRTGKRLFGEGTMPGAFKLTHFEPTPSGVVLLQTGSRRSGALGMMPRI